MTVTALHQTIDNMPYNIQEMIAEYAEFLAMKYNFVNNFGSQRHFAGCMKGTVNYISDDFNEPLDDFKDYM